MRDLTGKRVAVLVESEYIPKEISTYQTVFTERGAKLDFISRLWGDTQISFFSDVQKTGEELQKLAVSIDLESVNVDDYNAIIMAANYASVRLRYFEPPE